MSPFSGTVLVSAAVIASPALYQGFVTDVMPTEIAAVRYLVAVLICWAAISLATELLHTATAGTGRQDGAAESADPIDHDADAPAA